MALVSLPSRSLPGTLAAEGGETPPAPVSTTATASTKGADMAGGIGTFSRTILLPLLLALALYLVLFHALIPLYRRHRARYAQYLPLQTASSLSSHLPSSLQPSSLRDKLSTLFLRLFLPSTWAFRDRFFPGRGRANSIVSADDGALFDEESGEAMVGFDVQERNQRRNGLERQVSNMHAATRTVSGQRNEPVAVDSNRRLSRDLEEGFRDDSDDESEEGQVVVGRRSTSTRT
ncbi:hypothetical protein A1O7_03599 [Cladophialophora yegresii CBS 114405]|uniref:Uncharacterized protein n=1 Tax=Cladophialophora yegresii CBS 114405 TaxID=1182544 RepID=W9WY09_9EURO|nr:uncharacterized protein A1O7_03599 [Cladophialophora yegresii CBS 114405]EXJ63154.1 hypothetical protein A1O7_03599 [Cladophialophora yegresii CBS 114405]